MKKLIAFALAVVMLLSMTACGTVNETDVAILWSGDGIVHVPNSLINTMERAMYIENIAYTHYGANGDQASQTAQALDALNGGCAALAVELVEPAAAQEILDAAGEPMLSNYESWPAQGKLRPYEAVMYLLIKSE